MRVRFFCVTTIPYAVLFAKITVWLFYYIYFNIKRKKSQYAKEKNLLGFSKKLTFSCKWFTM